MVDQTVEQRDEAGGIGKDFVPFLEGFVSGDNERLAFVAAVDHLIQQIRRFVVERQIPDFIQAQESDVGVGPYLAAAAFGRLPLQIVQQGGSGAKDHGVTREHRLMAEVLGNHRLAQTVSAHQDKVARFAEKVERQGTLDEVAFDLGGPSPIEVGHGLEVLDTAKPQPPLQTAPRTFGHLGSGYFFQQLMGDQRALVARARKSSSSAGMAHKPI